MGASGNAEPTPARVQHVHTERAHALKLAAQAEAAAECRMRALARTHMQARTHARSHARSHAKSRSHTQARTRTGTDNTARAYQIVRSQVRADESKHIRGSGIVVREYCTAS
jgi:hypothetical protein